MEFIMQILAGGVSGIISGMGIGGGIILIPILTLILGYPQKSAQGMNLLYFLPTAASALFIHTKNKLIDTKLALNIGVGGIVGSVVGGLVLPYLSAGLLRKIFAFFLIIMGIYEFICANRIKK